MAQGEDGSADRFYVSITGLQVKRFWHFPAFMRHAVASMSQAKQAEGCISADARRINGVHHTRSIWESEAHMRAFLRAGAHGKAMRIFGKIATGKTFGYVAQNVPDWDEVHRLWREKGAAYVAPGKV